MQPGRSARARLLLPLRVVPAALVAGVLATSVALRFWTSSQLWLDEALTVNIARLPLAQIPQALRHDGSPPLYYVLLHFWMQAFGTGNLAVRSLSGLFGVATMVAIFFAARAYGGRTVAWAAVLLVGSSPFAVRYATETRMYSLLMLLTVLGLLALRRVLREPSPASLIALAAISGLALLTHYWSIYLVAGAGALLVVKWLRGRNRRALVAGLALAGGLVVFAPWLPTFLFQIRRTGTPWAYSPSLAAPIGTVTEWAGGGRDSGQVLGVLFLALATLGLLGRGIDERRVELDLATRPAGRALAAATFLTLGLAGVVGVVTRSAFVARYSSVVFPLFIILVALGIPTLLSPRIRTGMLAAMVVLGLLGAFPNAWTQRTEAGRVARALNAYASDGDVVAFCPDQLGPSVSRLVNRHLVELTFPDARAPQRVDWLDYAKRNRAAGVNRFEQLLLDRAGPHDIWLVWSGGYRTFGTKCETLLSRLGAARPGKLELVKGSGRYEEPLGLVQFSAS